MFIKSRQACTLTWDRSGGTSSRIQQAHKNQGFKILENGGEPPRHMQIRQQLLEQALLKMTQDIEVRLPFRVQS